MTHAQIDRRIARLVALCVAKIDADRSLLNRVVRPAVARISDPTVRRSWEELISRPWSEVRALLLAEGETADQLRQNAPFGGILSPTERMEVFRDSARA